MTCAPGTNNVLSHCRAQIALMLMWTEMRNRFDPEILRVFMNAMAIQPIKMVRNRTVTMG